MALADSPGLYWLLECKFTLVFLPNGSSVWELSWRTAKSQLVFLKEAHSLWDKTSGKRPGSPLKQTLQNSTSLRAFQSHGQSPGEPRGLVMCLSPLRSDHGCLKIRKPTRRWSQRYRHISDTIPAHLVERAMCPQGRLRSRLDSSWNFSSSNGRAEYPGTYPVNQLF